MPLTLIKHSENRKVHNCFSNVTVFIFRKVLPILTKNTRALKKFGFLFLSFIEWYHHEHTSISFCVCICYEPFVCECVENQQCLQTVINE